MVGLRLTGQQANNAQEGMKGIHLIYLEPKQRCRRCRDRTRNRIYVMIASHEWL